jgi:hypothetical protein
MSCSLLLPINAHNMLHFASNLVASWCLASPLLAGL